MRPVICTVYKGSRYKGSREAEMYLYVEKGSDLCQVPEELLSRLGKLQEVMTLALKPDSKLARVSTKQVLEQIAGKGYFLQMPPNIHAPVVSYGG